MCSYTLYVRTCAVCMFLSFGVVFYVLYMIVQEEGGGRDGGSEGGREGEGERVKEGGKEGEKVKERG